MKRCAKCRQELALAEFHKNRSTKDGYQAYCKACLRRARRLSYQTDPTATQAANRRGKIKRVYGITEELYDQMLAAYVSCPICGSTEEPHLDHDHATGQIRGFLCGRCNRALGLLGEDPERMKRLIAYVRKHKKVRD